MNRIDNSVANTPRANVTSVTIDRLVLRGLDPIARASLVEGLRSELARILADPQTRALQSNNRSLRIPVIRLGQVPLQPGTSGARHLGHTVARAISGVGTTAKGGHL